MNKTDKINELCKTVLKIIYLKENLMENKIEYHIETKKVRDTKCPIRMNMYDNQDFERCLSCAYFKDGNCKTKEYFVKFIKGSETDDDEYAKLN